MRKNAFQLSKEDCRVLETERMAAQIAKKYKYDRRLRGLLLCGREGGVEGIPVGSPPGRKRQMSQTQEETLAQMLEAGPFGYGFIHRILHHLGFTVQYPTRGLHGADNEEQQRWVKKYT